MRPLSPYAGPLVLVNASHPLVQSPQPELVPITEGQNAIYLERRAAGLLEACIRAVNGMGHIVPVSGWRSRQEQQSIWTDTLAQKGAAFTRKFVARPGCSEHETGLAIDLGLSAPHIDFIRPEFPDTGVCRAFRRRAADFGFILRYPAGKEAITGIAHEPWHFRYVGVPHAQIMLRRGLTLEEYLELLGRHSARNPLVFPSGHWEFSVFSQKGTCPAQATDGTACQLISGDNCGGWILTAWRTRRCTHEAAVLAD